MNFKIVSISDFDYYGRGYITIDADGYEYLFDLETKYPSYGDEISEYQHALNQEISGIVNSSGEFIDFVANSAPEDVEDAEEWFDALPQEEQNAISEAFAESAIDFANEMIADCHFIKHAVEAYIFAQKRSDDRCDIRPYGHPTQDGWMIDYGAEFGTAITPWVKDSSPAWAVVECWGYGEFVLQEIKPSLKEAITVAKRIAKDSREDNRVFD